VSALALALVLASAEPAPERLVTTEVSAGLGLLGTSFIARGARWGDFMWSPGVSGRVEWHGLTAEATVLFSVPDAPLGLAPSWSGTARVGYTGQRWLVQGGVAFGYTRGAQPGWTVLPSLVGRYDFAAIGVSAGVFDLAGLVPARLSAEFGRFSVGWVFPIGLIASGDVPLPDGFGLRVTGFAFKLGNAETAMVMFSGTWGPR
jgi:hypothetical protein